MATLDPIPRLDPVYELKTTDPIIGGFPVYDQTTGQPSQGYSNAQAQQLANRDAYIMSLVHTKADGHLVGEDNGICPLDSSGKVPYDRLPPLIISAGGLVGQIVGGDILSGGTLA